MHFPILNTDPNTHIAADISGGHHHPLLLISPPLFLPLSLHPRASVNLSHSPRSVLILHQDDTA